MTNVAEQLECIEWTSAPGVRAIFTNRSAGDVKGDIEARRRIGAMTGQARVSVADQVHGTDIVEAIGDWCDEAAPRVEADALIIRPGSATAAAVFVADCAPVVLAGPAGIAVVHAGWRGTINGIVERAAEALGSWTHACIGPCIGPCCLEMGTDVAGLFAEAHRLPHEDASKLYVDARAEIASRLSTTGSGQIDVIDICTKCDEQFFSFRREEGITGRQCGVAWFDGAPAVV